MQTCLNDSSNGIESYQVEAMDIKIEQSGSPSSSQKLTWLKIFCLSMIALMIGLLIFIIVMGIELSRLNEGIPNFIPNAQGP